MLYFKVMIGFFTLLTAIVWIKKPSAFNGLQFLIPFLELLSELIVIKPIWSSVFALLAFILAGIQLWILMKAIDKLIIKVIVTIVGLIIMLNIPLSAVIILFGVGSFSLVRFRKLSNI